MKCAIIHDLIPLYKEGLCSKDTAEVVAAHLKQCAECSTLYEEMGKALDIKEAPHNHDNKEDASFWRKYYGRLILKGTILFLLIYISIASIILIIK